MAKLFEIISEAYQSSTDPEIRQMIMQEFPAELLDKAGEMRRDIAYDNKTERYHTRESVRYGKRAEAVLADPVHTYPGWHNLIYPQVKQLLLEAFQQSANGKDSVQIRDPSLALALTSNTGFKITVDRLSGRISYQGQDSWYYVCDMRGLGESPSGSFRVSVNLFQLTEESIKSIRPEDMNIYCFHDFARIDALNPCLENLISWKLSDGAQKFKEHLWNLLAMMSKGSYFERGQAAITEWIMIAFSKSNKYKLVFNDVWKADGKRTNLTPDLRSLSAFDNNMAMNQFKAEVQLIADSLE